MKKRALLLGDSIRMGYEEKVRELLKDEVEVFFPEDNGRFAAYTLWQANQFFKNCGPVDLVHWNNGYWDMNIEAPMKEPIHPVDEYVHILERIIRLCRGNEAKIIFATTTPIYEGEDVKSSIRRENRSGYRNSWVKDYNKAAIALMEKEEIPVNDLYSLCLNAPAYYKCEDMLHLTEEGYWALARQTADCIKEQIHKNC